MITALAFLASDSRQAISASVRFLPDIGGQTAAELTFTVVLLLVRRASNVVVAHPRFPIIPLEISMNLKLVVAVSLFAVVPMVAFAQKDAPATKVPKPTIADAQKLVQTISGDKAKLQAYCDMGKLQEEMEKADQKNDTKALDALGAKADSLAQQIGPEYTKVMDGLEEVDPNSAEGKQYTAVFATLIKQCK